MRSSSIPRLLAAAAVALFMSCGLLAAQESNTGSVVVTLPADMDGEDRRALTDALAALDRPVAIADTGQVPEVLTAESQVTVAMGRWDSALASWRDLPELMATWWRGLSAENDGAGSLLAVAAMLVALAVGAACEWGVDRLLSSWRRQCAQAQPVRFSQRAGYGLAWVGLEALGIAAFAGGALLIGWLLLPALSTPRLTLAIIVAAVVKARLVLTIARFILAPYRPALRLVSMPDGAARLVWRWVAIVVTIIAAANGFRDVLVSSGAS